MALIICPQCRAEYEVPLKVLEKRVKCQECGHSFRAQSRKAAKKPEKKKPMLWPIIILCAGLFVVVILIVESNIDRDGSGEAPADTSVEPDDQASAGSGTDLPPFPPPVVRTETEKFCRRFVGSLGENDIDAIAEMISFSFYHNSQSGGEGTLWSDLEELDRFLKRKEYLEALTADTPEGTGFVRFAAVESSAELSSDGRKAEVELLLRNVMNGRRQKRTFQLAKLGDSWAVAGQTIGPEYGGDLDFVAEEGPKTLDEKYKHRISPEGAIAPVEFLPETSESKRRELTRLVEDLVGKDKTRSHDARERLIAAGRPAVPALLNGMVPFDYGDSDDIAKANKYIYVLRLVTGQSFGFMPGFQDVAIRGSMEEDLKHAVRLWFGWWIRYKDVWEGRDIKKEMKDW